MCVLGRPRPAPTGSNPLWGEPAAAKNQRVDGVSIADEYRTFCIAPSRSSSVPSRRWSRSMTNCGGESAALHKRIFCFDGRLGECGRLPPPRSFAGKDNARAIVVMAYGTGKTLVALWATKQAKPRAALVLLPSPMFLQQTLREWSQHTSWGSRFSYLCVFRQDGRLAQRQHKYR